ncbi:class I SAM-dependent methyltransferase, partial [candidate division CSSED10-310 bacterium]
MPEIYQDVLIRGKVVKQGVRKCSDRLRVLKEVVRILPFGFKVLDVGASQGYFSFHMAEQFGARCTMIEDGYTTTQHVWQTAEYLKYLCEQNSHLKNLTLLKMRMFADDLRKLRELEYFDLVCAFSVIHHMRRSEHESFSSFLEIIDALINLAPLAIIENPINTGDHTQFIREALQERDGKVINTSNRGNTVYEIYLFNTRCSRKEKETLSNIS